MATAREKTTTVERVRPKYGLTGQEMLITGLIAEGRNYSAIADLLSITRDTVKWHAKNAAAKIPGDLPAQMKLAVWYRGAPIFVLTGEGSVR